MSHLKLSLPHSPYSYVIAILVLGNQLAFTTVTVFFIHIIINCNFPSQLMISNVNGRSWNNFNNYSD